MDGPQHGETHHTHNITPQGFQKKKVPIISKLWVPISKQKCQLWVPISKKKVSISKKKCQFQKKKCQLIGTFFLKLAPIIGTFFLKLALFF